MFSQDVEAAILGCRSTQHPCCVFSRVPEFFPGLRNRPLEAALTGTLEAYLHKLALPEIHRE